MEEYLFDNMARTERDHWWFEGRRAIVLSVIRQIGMHDARILDVGAGTGATTLALREFGRVDALELAPAALEHLRQHPDLTVFDSSLEAADLATASYDLVTAFDVLEHIGEHEAAVAQIGRLLRPGGYFVCTVPAHPALWTAHDEHHHHQRRYTRHALRSALEGGGLEVCFLSPWFTVLFPLFLADRLRMRLRPPEDATVSVPVRPLNALFRALLAVEANWLGRWVSAPVGASLLAVAQRPG